MPQLRSEWDRLHRALQALDTQFVVVLVAATALVLLQMQVGDRSIYTRTLDNPLELTHPALGGWGWWFTIQGVTGFIIPVLILVFGFRRRLGEIGLGWGDWKLASLLAAAYMPLVIVGTWVLSDGAAFQQQYPHYSGAQTSWRLFLIYEALFLFYWIGWEYLWRGFVLFGTAPAIGGTAAVVLQTVPFAILHASKPAAEAYLSILGGLALGALVWRCRSFWIAVPIHAAQMMALDVWCTLRARSGASGIGWEALREALVAGL